MKYSIVIPTYNNCEKFLKPCIKAVLKYSFIKDIEIVISANGCTDNTNEYLNSLKQTFEYLGLQDHLKIVWNDSALGYAKATNAGILASSCDMLVMLNNDVVLLPQRKNDWLNMLYSAFETNPKCGISCSLLKYSEIVKLYFGLFFCVMFPKKLINEIGLLDERYETGGNEDIDFCTAAQILGYEVIQPVPIQWDSKAQTHVGIFPLFHAGEGTVHDPTLVSDWETTFRKNELKLAKKYNNDWYLANKDTLV